MSLADYLAKNYLTADSSQKSSKKRKRKDRVDQGSSHGLSIAEDGSWASVEAQDADQDDTPTVVNDPTRPNVKKGSWKKSGAQTSQATASLPKDQAAADAIIASAVAENQAIADAEAAEDAPQMVEGGIAGSADVPMMESGAAAGLQSAAQVTAQMERRRAQERKRFDADDAGGKVVTGKGQDTIYRDASGRIINIAMKRAEARREAEAEQLKKKEALEAQKGDVQRAEKEKARQDLKDARTLTVARYADDEELNDELKERERWNDPAAQFLTKKTEKRSGTGKSLYKGSAAPNRYGIRPGYRWDGVDRSNGFERQYFAAHNKKKNERDLRYQWEMDE